MTGQPPIIPLGPRGRLGVEGLNEKSHAAPMDLNQVAPWARGQPMHPVAGIIATLLLEWVAELSAMFVSQDDVVDPLTREMFHQHHLEEARHIAFGRWVGESFFEHAPDDQATQMRQILGISPWTVKVHVRNFMAKLNVSTRGRAAAMAMKNGLVTL